MKKVYYVLLFLIILFPITINALNSNYDDKIEDIVNISAEEDKIAIYFFHSDECMHCAKEEVFLEEIEKKYEEIVIYKYEIHDAINYEYMQKAKELMGVNQPGVPFTVIGDTYYFGYDDYTGETIEDKIIYYLEDNEEDNTIRGFSLFGKKIEFDIKDVSIPLIAVVFGLIDGFNPCAMWVLIFLITMLIGMHNKKRMFIFGATFLFTSGFVYFLSMLGINAIFSVVSVSILQKVIATVALIAGLFNIRTFIKTKDDGCHVVDAKKRKSIFKRTDKIVKQDKFILALLGIIGLAITVNLVELACTAVFPAMFDSILAFNEIKGITRIIYLILYVIFYMLDDMIVFIIAMKTLSIKGISNKYSKYVSLIAGIIMIIIGILLIFKPSWIMFNF